MAARRWFSSLLIRPGSHVPSGCLARVSDYNEGLTEDVRKLPNKQFGDHFKVSEKDRDGESRGAAGHQRRKFGLTDGAAPTQEQLIATTGQHRADIISYLYPPKK